MLVQSAITTLKEMKSPGWYLYASSGQREAARRLFQFVATSKDLVAEANRGFVDSELLKFTEFFDSVESKPLTDAQRRSCIVSEDNNLVLAGAGTGKTRTMIGRAGYLMASRRANSKNILMLAFVRKAAGEMQERQDERLEAWLGDGSPTIKTFHALGLEIIGTVDGRRPDLTPMAEDKHRFAKFIDEQLASAVTTHTTKRKSFDTSTARDTRIGTPSTLIL